MHSQALEKLYSGVILSYRDMFLLTSHLSPWSRLALLQPWLIWDDSLVSSAGDHWSIFQATKQVWHSSEHICSLYSYSVLLYDTTFYGLSKIKIISIKLAQHLIKSTEKACCWRICKHKITRVLSTVWEKHTHMLGFNVVPVSCSTFLLLFCPDSSNLSSPSCGSSLSLL